MAISDKRVELPPIDGFSATWREFKDGDPGIIFANDQTNKVSAQIALYEQPVFHILSWPTLLTSTEVIEVFRREASGMEAKNFICSNDDDSSSWREGKSLDEVILPHNMTFIRAFGKQKSLLWQDAVDGDLVKRPFVEPHMSWFSVLHPTEAQTQAVIKETINPEHIDHVDVALVAIGKIYEKYKSGFDPLDHQD